MYCFYLNLCVESWLVRKLIINHLIQSLNDFNIKNLIFIISTPHRQLHDCDTTTNWHVRHSRHNLSANWLRKLYDPLNLRRILQYDLAKGHKIVQGHRLAIAGLPRVRCVSAFFPWWPLHNCTLRSDRLMLIRNVPGDVRWSSAA